MTLEQPRVRAHVARAVTRARHLILSFDGVLADVSAALDPGARPAVIAAALRDLPHQPRPLTADLRYLAVNEPKTAKIVEKAVTVLEIDAALTARPADGLAGILEACAATGRDVAVLSDLAEEAVRAVLGAYEVEHLVDAVAARHGIYLDTFDAGADIARAVEMLDVPPEDCLVVTGDGSLIQRARDHGVPCLGVECGRDSRKWLAAAEVPVVPRLAVLEHALLL